MSIFTDDTLNVSKSFAEAITKTATSGIEANTEKTLPITEEMVMIPGYGMMSRDRAVIEAQTSHRNAESHMKMGNHQGASYHHKRAAMFHDALANAEGTTQQADPGRTSTTAEAIQLASVHTDDLTEAYKRKTGRPSLDQARREYVHRFTGEHVPNWAQKPAQNGKHYAPQYSSDQEWYNNTKFPGEPGGPHPRSRHAESSKQSWPHGQWLDKPFQVGQKRTNESVTEGFKGLKHGDRVTFKTPQGQERTGTVNGLLVSHSHAVVDCGGRHGTPAVVNDKNYVSHKSKGMKEETVTEANQEPHESRLQNKFKHAQRRKLRMKSRDADKKDRKEDRYK